MISNVIDRRTRPFRWKHVNAIIEATWHDNSCEDSDQAEPAADDIEVTYDEKVSISLSDAIAWASADPCPVTLYIYDEGAGTTAA